MKPAEAWTRLLAQNEEGDPLATIGERTVVMGETTPTYTPTADSQTVATTGRALSSEMSLDPIARFRFIDSIGRGGMGEVLRVEQTSIGRQIALKTLRRDRSQSGTCDAFQAETRITAVLEHPGVVPVHDAGVDFMAMKLVEGRTLGERLAAREDLDDDLADLIEVLLRVADCLAYAHDRGILHRDLKPENIMAGRFGEVYLMDWGLALTFGEVGADHHLPHVSTAVNICAGSPAYLPPEVSRGERNLIGAASDVFGLGAILYEILTGEAPFAGETLHKVLTHAAECRRTPLPTERVERQPELCDLCEAMLHAEPGRRLSLMECQRRLRSWLEVSGRREAARQHHRTAQIAFDRACVATDSGVIYRLLIDCANECERALALDTRRESSRRLRRDAHRRYAEEAIRAGDLVLAQAVLDEDEDPALEPLRERVAKGFARRDRWAQRTIVARRWSLRLALTAAGLLVLAAGFHLLEQRHNRHQRRIQAEDMLSAGAPSIGAGQIEHQRSVNRHLQAMGLHPEPQTIEPQLRRAAVAFSRWAIADESAELARAQLRLAIRHGLDPEQAETLEGDTDQPGTIAYAASARDRARRAERIRRRDRMDQIETEAATRRMEPDWLAKRVAELSAWRVDHDDATTAEHTGRLFARLRYHRDPLLRLIAHHLWRVLDADPNAPQVARWIPPPSLPDLVPQDPDQRVQVEAIINLAQHDMEMVALIMEAIVALERNADVKLVAERLKSEISNTLAPMKKRIRSDPHWMDVAVLLTHRRLALAMGDSSRADSMRYSWGERIGYHLRMCSWAERQGKISLMLEHAFKGLDLERSESALCYGLRAALMLEDDAAFQRLLDRWHELEGPAVSTYPYHASLFIGRNEIEAANRLLDLTLDHILDGQALPHWSMVFLMIELRRADRSDEAIMISRHMADSAPTSPVVFNNVGWTLHEAGRDQEAVHRAIKTLERWPGNWHPWALMVWAYSDLGRYRESIAAAERVLATKQDYQEMLGKYGMSLITIGRWTKGIATIADAFATSESRSRLEFLDAAVRTAWHHGDVERLQHIIDRRLAIAPTDEDYRAAAVRVRLEQGDIDGALELVEDSHRAGHPIDGALRHLLFACGERRGLLDLIATAETVADFHLREALAALAWPERADAGALAGLLAAARHDTNAPWIEATAAWIEAAASGSTSAPTVPEALTGQAWALALIAANSDTRRSANGHLLIMAEDELLVWRPLPELRWQPGQLARLADLLRHPASTSAGDGNAFDWQRASDAVAPGP